jgi:chaperonin GroES
MMHRVIPVIDRRQGNRRGDPAIRAYRVCSSEDWDMPGFKPLQDRVLLKRVEAEETTAGGIIIPDTAKEKPAEGEVLAVGSGTRDESGKLHPPEVKIGDRVLFGKWAGTEVLIDGADRVILKESEILGIFETAGA